MPKVTVRCAHCDNLKQVYPSKVKDNKTGNFFCNQDCYHQWRSENVRGAAHPQWRGGKITVHCDWCGAPKQIWPARTEEQGNFFCDLDCCDAWKHDQATEVVACVGCGERFKAPKRHNRKYCSRHCANQHSWQERENVLQRPDGYNNRLWRRIYYHVCPSCGELFIGHHQNRKYCSRDCAADSLRQRDISVCEQCNQEFEHYPHEPRRFCSRKCYFQSERPTNKIAFECLQCGIEFYDWPETHRVFCSHACKGKWQIINLRGENNPSWAGGYEPYYGPNWISQRRKARARDSYRCQHCNISETKLDRALDVHHIVPFREYGLEKYKQANRLTNLISLCQKCHKAAEYQLDAIQPKLL